MQPKAQEQETEAALVLCTEDPLGVTRHISSLSEIASYQLLFRPPDTIHDLYLDTGKHELQAKKLALRVREVGERRQITLKGPGRATDWGGEARLEIEAPWSHKAVDRVVKELADRQIHLPAKVSQFDQADPLVTLARLGLEVSQDRVTQRQPRDVVATDRPHDPALAELAIDHVVYQFGDQHVGFHEVEIEAKRENGLAATRVVTERLAERYGPALQAWGYSKLAIGNAIEKLLRDGSLDGLIDAQSDLMPSALAKVEALLMSGVV
jgi:inorganic triphosphatase YgiF